jgi:spoIIIJ-associated protein
MEESIRVTAKTVEDAITEASIQLGTSRDNIEYTVLEKGTSGFFGIGGKKAVIEAKKKITDEDIMKEVFGEEKPKKEFKKEAKKEFKKEKKEVKEVKKESKKEFKEEKKASRPEEKPVRKEAKKEIRSEEKETKEVKEVKEVNAVKAQPKEDAAEPETAKKEAAPKAPRVPADPAEVIRRAEEFLKNVFATMDMEVEIKASFEEDVLTVDLSGDNMGLLIGKRGQTLDSLQYLTSLVVNKGKASYVRVKLDTEDYRNRRKATLENLAKNIAFKVKKTRRPVFLEPMNPYERRIIHSALQNDPYVTTHSEGDEPCRKVVVTLRKKS